jgi:hypothetical protein
MVFINPHPSFVPCVLQLALLVIDQHLTAPVAAFRALSTGTSMISNALRAVRPASLMWARLVKNAILSVPLVGI